MLGGIGSASSQGDRQVHTRHVSICMGGESCPEQMVDEKSLRHRTLLLFVLPPLLAAWRHRAAWPSCFEEGATRRLIAVLVSAHGITACIDAWPTTCARSRPSLPLPLAKQHQRGTPIRLDGRQARHLIGCTVKPPVSSRPPTISGAPMRGIQPHKHNCCLARPVYGTHCYRCRDCASVLPEAYISALPASSCLLCCSNPCPPRAPAHELHFGVNWLDLVAAQSRTKSSQCVPCEQ